jgi:multimeric flavodoxin WrbA
MRVEFLCGSRNRNGQTARATAAFALGATDAGGLVETEFLPELDIRRCRQCDADGWGLCRREGRCCIEDDFDRVAEAVRAADALVVATPVYFGEISESLRAFLDRLRRLCMHERGKVGIAGKPALGICVAGGGGGGAPACAAELVRVLQTCGFDVLDMVAVRRQNLDLKTQVLELTGRWLVGAIQPHEPPQTV